MRIRSHYGSETPRARQPSTGVRNVVGAISRERCAVASTLET